MTQCRFCKTALTHQFLDLGVQPLANSYLSVEDIAHEIKLPLRVYVCNSCWLVQTDETPSPQRIFGKYAYFSSQSSSFVEYSRQYAERLAQTLSLDGSSMVLEVASNDGYLLQHFVSAGIPVLGIEPAANVAAVALARGVPTRSIFFNEETALALKAENIAADLIVANNVLAHVPDIRGFTSAFRHVLKPHGVATFEFPHLSKLIEFCQFDTVYHEHYFYLSLTALQRVFELAHLRIFDYEEIPTHGGSLRLYVCHSEASNKTHDRVAKMLAREAEMQLNSLDGYSGMQGRTEEIRREFDKFLKAQLSAGMRVAGYGAAAKGNTFLNYCGVTSDMLLAVADKSPEKQNKLLPGTHIPVVSPEELRAMRPDLVLILPWNIKEEIRSQLRDLEREGTRFVTAIPSLEIMS